MEFGDTTMPTKVDYIIENIAEENKNTNDDLMDEDFKRSNSVMQFQSASKIESNTVDSPYKKDSKLKSLR